LISVNALAIAQFPSRRVIRKYLLIGLHVRVVTELVPIMHGKAISMKRFAIISAICAASLGMGVGIAAASSNSGPLCHRGSTVVFAGICPRGYSSVSLPRGPRGYRGPRGGRGPRGIPGPAGTSQLANATIVSSAGTLGNASTATFTASCPSGTRAIAGGASSNDFSGTAHIDFTYPSGISSTGSANSWSVVVTNNSGAARKVTAYAECA